MSFKIGGCKVTVSFFFFAVLCICALSDKSGLLVSGILAAVLHELGHLVSTFSLRLPPKTLALSSAGMVMHIPNLNRRSRACVIISLSGPAINLLIFFCFFPFFKSFAAANLALCILNLLPCDPFDGGHILRIILEKRLSEETSDRIILICTLLVLFFLVTFGTLILIESKYNFSLLTLSMLIFTTICQRTLK